ncbi:hypothetical protein F511_11262 [Dorcoceras hygrometricum]|uniref:Uncharacterized protein n=1 Tax=Dorcoceras hygrometricum TaxID=472368 RepID=A0A2Z7CIH8_9LAMI|nr:hypothetical protein F511_11262 [Dorcoceras hygrometricum]
MVVDLIGIYVLRGPYCTLTTTNWFLQALSVIPRGSWGDVARRFNMIRWATPKQPPTSSPLGRTHAPPSATHAPPPLRRTSSGHRAEEIPSVVNLSDLLVQTDKIIVIPVVDLIRRSTAAYLLMCRFPCETGRSQAPRRRQRNDSNILCMDYRIVCNVLNVSRGKILNFRYAPGKRDPDTPLSPTVVSESKARILQYISLPELHRSRIFEIKTKKKLLEPAAGAAAQGGATTHAHERALHRAVRPTPSGFVIEDVNTSRKIPAVTMSADFGEQQLSNAIIGVVTAGFERLLPICDGLTGPEYHGPMIFIG